MFFSDLPTFAWWFFFSQRLIYIYREGKGRRKRVRETLICERNVSRLSLTCPQPGVWPATQTSVLTSNWPGDLWVCRMMPCLVSHTSQGCSDVSWNKRSASVKNNGNSQWEIALKARAVIFWQERRWKERKVNSVRIFLENSAVRCEHAWRCRPRAGSEDYKSRAVFVGVWVA